MTNVHDVPAQDDDIAKDYNNYSKSYNRLNDGGIAQAVGIEVSVTCCISSQSQQELRCGLLSKANGRVLEIGVGTGINFPFLNWENISAYEGVDVSKGMLEQVNITSNQTTLRSVSGERTNRA